MEEGTHMKTLEDSVKKTEALLQHMQQLFASLKQTTQASARSQEETRLETDQSFGTLCELILGMTAKEITPSVVLEDDISSSERIQPRNAPEDNGDHPREESPANASDFALEIEGIIEPTPRTEETARALNAMPISPISTPIASGALRDGSKGQEIAHSNPIHVLHIRSSQGDDIDTTSVDLSEGECSDPTIAWGIGVRRGQESKFSSSPQLEVDAPWQALQIQFEYSKVISNFPNLGRIIVASSENFVVKDVHLANRMNSEKLRTAFGVKLMEFLEISNARKVFVKRPSAVNTIEILGIPSAYKVFVKLLVKKTCVVECVDVSISSVKAKTAHQVFDGMGRSEITAIFDPGGSLDVLNGESGVGKVIDMVSIDPVGCNLSTDALFSLQCIKDRLNLMPFDRGRVDVILVGLGRVSVTSYIGRSLGMVFDPGGMCELWIIFPSMTGLHGEAA